MSLHAISSELAKDLQVLYKYQKFKTKNEATRNTFASVPDLARVRVALVGQNALTGSRISSEDRQSIDILVEIEGSTQPLEEAMHLIRPKYATYAPGHFKFLHGGRRTRIRFVPYKSVLPPDRNGNVDFPAKGDYIPNLQDTIPYASVLTRTSTSIHRGCQGAKQLEIRQESSQARYPAVATAISSLTSSISPALTIAPPTDPSVFTTPIHVLSNPSKSPAFAGSPSRGSDRGSACASSRASSSDPGRTSTRASAPALSRPFYRDILVAAFVFSTYLLVGFLLSLRKNGNGDEDLVSNRGDVIINILTG